jgi:hypothetical protein
LDAAVEDHRVSERIVVLERVRLILTVFGLMHGDAKPWFGCKMVPIILRKLWRVAERL